MCKKVFILAISAMLLPLVAAKPPVYPKPGNRGITPQIVMSKAQNKVTVSRPQIIADLLKTKQSDAAGIAKQQTVKVELLEDAGVARNAEIRFGFPLPDKMVYDPENIAVFAPCGKQIPAQIAILNFHDSKALRQVLITCFYPLKSGEKAALEVRYGGKTRNISGTGVKLIKKGDLYLIDTGVMQCVVNSKKFNLAENVVVKGKNVAAFEKDRAVVLEKDGAELFISTLAPERIDISEKGSLRTTLRIAGRYADKNGKPSTQHYIVRLTFRAGRSDIETEFTHFNKELEHEFTDLKSLKVNFAAKSAGVSGSVNGKSISGSRLFQETEREYTVDGKARIKGSFCGGFTAGNNGIAFYQIRERYPKAVSVSADGKAVLELLPTQPHKNFNRDMEHYLTYLFSNGLYRFKWGMSFAEKFVFIPEKSAVKAAVAELNMPVVAVIPADYYAACGRISKHYRDFAAIDARLIDALNRHIEGRESVREFGFLNFGDSFGERGHNWANNEYDPADSISQLFMRTGCRKALRFVRDAARHQATVDTCHAYPDPYYIGGNLQHAVGHTGIDRIWSAPYSYYSAASGGHTWVRGMLRVVGFTGDLTVMDSVYKTGDHIALAVVPNYKSIRFVPHYGPNWLGRAPREAGWMLRALTGLWIGTRDPVYRKAADTLAALAIKECAYEKGAWPRRMHRMSKTYKIHVEGNTVFQASILLRGLCDYEYTFKNGKALRAIHSTAKWISKAFHPEDSCSFNYDMAGDGTQLNWPLTGTNGTISPGVTDAAVLCNDVKLLEIGCKSMATIMSRTFPHNNKAFNSAPTFFGDFINAIGKWKDEHPANSFKFPVWETDALIDYVLDYKGRTFRKRGRSLFEITLSAPTVEVVMQRWIRSGVNTKTPRNKFKMELKDSKGKVISVIPFDPVKLGQKVSVKISGKPGERFLIDVTDTPNNDWTVIPGNGFKSCVICRRFQPIQLAHNGLRKLSFVIPANKAMNLTAYGTHIGWWHARIMDESGKILAEKRAYTPDVSLQQKPKEVLTYKFPAHPKKRVYSIMCSALGDFRIETDVTIRLFSE